MNREKKELVIEGLKQDFSKSNATFLVNYKGLTVVDMQKLRRELRSCGGKLKVAKDRLVKLAIQEMPGVQDLNPLLKNQVAVVFAGNEPEATAKVLHGFKKEVEKFDIVAGCIEAKIIGKDLIITLASLPSRQVLLAQLCGVLSAPVAALARTLSAVAESKATPAPVQEPVAVESAAQEAAASESAVVEEAAQKEESEQ